MKWEIPVATRISGMAWSPDNQWIAIATADGDTYNNIRIEIYAVSDGQLETTFMSHDNGFSSAYALAWSPDSQYLAAGYGDGGIEIWSMSEPEQPVLMAFEHYQRNYDTHNVN